MEKPIVFISHSSRDERMVRKLKEVLTKKVGNTLDIFVSSDGQSIPLGRNWVHEIEQALKKSKIMFVLLSPNSIRSNWIYFEAGFAYSLNIKVVPIGVLGIDLSKIAPPLSLLQGFNINSVETLNNIISILNKEFDYSLETSFDYKEYAEIFGIQTAKTSGIFKEYISLVDDISSEVVSAIDKPLEAIIDYFKSNKIEYQSSEKMIDTYGMSIEQNEKLFNCKIAPNLIDSTVPLLNEITKIIRGSSFEFYPLTIDFIPTVNCILEKHKVTSRIYKTEIKILDNYYFDYYKIAFRIDRRRYWGGFSPSLSSASDFFSLHSQYEIGPVSLEVKYYGQNLVDIPIYTLLSKLLELGVLYQG